MAWPISAGLRRRRHRLRGRDGDVLGVVGIGRKGAEAVIEATISAPRRDVLARFSSPPSGARRRSRKVAFERSFGSRVLRRLLKDAGVADERRPDGLGPRPASQRTPFPARDGRTQQFRDACHHEEAHVHKTAACPGRGASRGPA